MKIMKEVKTEITLKDLDKADAQYKKDIEKIDKGMKELSKTKLINLFLLPMYLTP